MKKTWFRNRGGWTLVELLVTIGVVGVVLSIAAWGMGAAMGEQSLRGAARRLESLMKEAKLLAYEKGITHSIIFSPDGSRYVVFRDDDGNGELDAGESVLHRVVLDRGVTIANNTLPNNASGWRVVRFDSRGRAAIGGAAEKKVVFASSSGSKTTSLRINMVARVRVVTGS